MRGAIKGNIRFISSTHPLRGKMGIHQQHSPLEGEDGQCEVAIDAQLRQRPIRAERRAKRAPADGAKGIAAEVERHEPIVGCDHRHREDGHVGIAQPVLPQSADDARTQHPCERLEGCWPVARGQLERTPIAEQAGRERTCLHLWGEERAPW